MIQSFTAEQIAAPMRLADRDLAAGQRIADRQTDAERIQRVALHRGQIGAGPLALARASPAGR